MMLSRVLPGDSTARERAAVRVDLFPRFSANAQVLYDEVRRWISTISLPVRRD